MTKNVVAENWTSILQSWNDGTKRTWAQMIAGMLAEGHYLPRIQPLVVIHPRPDTETNTSARHRYAFYDGVNPMLCDIPIDVIGGSYPQVPVIVSGPPGATIVMPDYSAGPPYASPRFQWTPGATWSGTVSIDWYSQEYQTDNTQVINQSFSHSTSPSIAETNPLTGEPGVFIFANKDSGLSTGAGSYASPIDDMPTACGTTAAAAPTIGGVATAGKILVLMPSTAEYILPLYTSGGGTSYLPTVASKPTSYIGIPGAAQPKFSAALAYGGTAAATIVIGITGASDLFFSNLNPDGYNTTSGSGGSYNTRLINISGTGNARITVDSITWTNSGWGAQSGGGADNSGIFTTSNVSSFRQHIYCNNCREPSRQSGNPGNNYCGPTYYSVQYSLIQGYSCDNPSQIADTGSYLKVDCANSEVRGCYYNVSNVLYPCSTGEAVLETYAYCDMTYNLLINCNLIKNPSLNSGSSVQTYLRVARNSIISPSGLGISSGSPDTGAGPFMVESNVVQGPDVVLPTAGNGNTSDGLNQFSTSATLLNTTTGLLVSETYRYLIGAEIG